MSFSIQKSQAFLLIVVLKIKKNNNLRKSKSYCIESEGFYLFKKSLALLDRELPRLGMLFFGQYRPF